jgi:hypothetical protein
MHNSWERKWKINVGTNGLEDAVFKLEKHTSYEKTWYEMIFDKCNDPDTWSDSRFDELGYAHLDWAPQTKLPPYDPSIDPVYQAAIVEFLKRVSTVTKRLQTIIDISVPIASVQKRSKSASQDPIVDVVISPVVVTLLIAKDAIQLKKKRTRDLLIVVCRSTLFGGGTITRPDGTGHGDPT